MPSHMAVGHGIWSPEILVGGPCLLVHPGGGASFLRGFQTDQPTQQVVWFQTVLPKQTVMLPLNH